MATARRKLSLDLLKQALENTTKLSCFVLFILIGSTVFSFTFNAAEGHVWVEHLFTNMPGGAMGFLIVVNILVFILGMFIDFFEIAFIVIPMFAPVAEKILPALLPAGTSVDAVLIWFGVIIAMNLQTSFLTPPFGFALFYLRSVAARNDYKDRMTGETIPAVTTAQIYKGAIAFIVIQLIMVVAVVVFPGNRDRYGDQGGRRPRQDRARCAARGATATRSRTRCEASGCPVEPRPTHPRPHRPRKTRWKRSSARCRTRRRSSTARAAFQRFHRNEKGPQLRAFFIELSNRSDYSFCACMKSSNPASAKRNQRFSSRRKVS